MGLLGVVLPQSKIFVNFVNFQVFFHAFDLSFWILNHVFRGVLIVLNDPRWKKFQGDWKKKNRVEIGAETEQKQGKNRALRNFAGWRKPLRNEHFVAKPFRNTVEVSARVFRSCESKFGTRVPLRSIVASIWQLRNALRRGKAWFRTKSPILQGISQLRKWFWHTSATSQHRNFHFAAAKRTVKLLRNWHFAAKLAFCCETQTDP